MSDLWGSRLMGRIVRLIKVFGGAIVLVSWLVVLLRMALKHICG